jgi:hypothetical protein
MRRPLGKVRFDQFAEKGLRICVWQDEQVAMVMAGKMPVAEMQHLASLVYNGVEL